MTQKRRTCRALIERRGKTLQLHLAGLTQQEIADQVGIHRSVVCRDLQSLRDGSRFAEALDPDEARSIHLLKIDQLETAYWEAWDQSRLGKETKTAQQSAADGREQVSLTRQRRAGNPALLMGILRCIEKREAILGLLQKPALSAQPTRRVPR